MQNHRITKLLLAFCLIASFTTQAQQINYTWNGSNGATGLTEYGIVTQANAGQATLGAEANGDLYANLNLGTNISGTRKFWHISKRRVDENHNLHFYFWDGSVFKKPALALTAIGYVGIGNVNPENKISVIGEEAGTQQSTKPVGKFINTGSAYSKLVLGSDNTHYDAVISMDNNAALSNTKLRLYIGNGVMPTAGHNNDQIVLTGNGNVGIGTAIPDQKLTVKGVIHTNEVRVDVAPPIQGPDYVFEKDYNLLPLAELETYIHENKHLPEVPSAKEMEANGLNLKEMNLLLLKKVEELTLHLIEANHEIKKLNERVDELSTTKTK